MKKLDFFQLKFKDNLFIVIEALQYYVIDSNVQNCENTDTYTNKRKFYHLCRIKRNINYDVVNEIKEFKKQYSEELEQNPLFDGLLDLYIELAKNKNEKDFNEIYKKYQELQQKYPFEKNIKNYIEMGCRLCMFPDNKKDVFLLYPLTLFTAYVENGGKDSDHRGGYLYPIQKLTIEQIKEIYKISPEIFDNIKDAKTNYKLDDNSLENV